MNIVTGVKIEQMLSKITYQTKMELKNSFMSVDTIFNSAIEIIMLWLQRKLNNNPDPFKQLLNDAYQDIYVEHGGIRVDVAHMLQPLKWAMKFKQPDSTFAARTWTTQVIIAKQDETIVFSAINTCTCPSSSAESIPLSIPGFIRTLVEQIGIHDVKAVGIKPWEIETSDDIQALFDLLVSAARHLPVVVLTQKRHLYCLDHELTARKLAGIAHVVCISQKFSFTWSELVGKEWSVFNGGVRTYFPALDFKYSDMYDHPLVLSDKILTWQTEGSPAADAFLNFLVSSLLSYNAKQTRVFSDNEIFNELRQVKLSQEIAKAKDSTTEQSTLLELYQEENAQLHESLILLRQQCSGLESDFLNVEIENDELKRERNNLLVRLDYLEDTAFNSGTNHEEIAIPTTYKELASWCEEFLPQKLILSSKAKRMIKDAQFLDVPLVYHALLLYANEYRNMRMRLVNDTQAKSAYETKLSELCLEDCGKPISDSRRGEQGDEYYVTINGIKCEFEHHIGKGRGGMDPSYCMRIYTVWDSESNRVIVGALPGHLNLRSSN